MHDAQCHSVRPCQNACACRDCAGFCLRLIPAKAQGRDSFHAALIKRGPEGIPPAPRLEVHSAVVHAPCISLRHLITQAFGVEDYQLSGISGWMESDTYAITAESEGLVDGAEMLTMLRTLLAKIFQLRVHHESRIVPAFALTVDKSGPKLAPLGRDEDWTDSDSSADRPAFLIGSSIQELVGYLNSQRGQSALGRPVVDRTGLRGLYRIRLVFSGEKDPKTSGIRLKIDYPSALIQQLGLRLEATTAAMDVLVIDNAERILPLMSPTSPGAVRCLS